MKLFIVLALASVALATPLVQPVVMPEAPLPEFEDNSYVPMIEPVAIKPLFVPQEIIEALKLAEEQVPADAEAVFEAMEQAAEADVVHVVEYVVYENDADHIAAEEDVAPAVVEDIPADAVHFVDVAENIDSDVAQEEVAAPAVEEIPADAVHFVDVAENIDSEVAQEVVAAPAVEEIPADAVNFVEVAENLEGEVAPAVEAIEHADEEVVHVVDYVVYENDADHVAEEIPADAVNFVDVAENIENSEVAEEQMNAEEILPEAVHFVDNAEDIEPAAGDVEEASAVKVVEVAPVADNDLPRYPGKIYENPMLRKF